MHYKNILFFLIIISSLAFISCDQLASLDSGNNITGEWLIPKSNIFDGGPGKDGIPAISDPDFDFLDEITYLEDNELVLIVKIGTQVKIYPHQILDWHEIVNDVIGSTYYSLTYCPLTGSALLWNREIDGSVTTFGVSGLLYNSNLIPYDRETGSNWSQMEMRCVNGEHIGLDAEVLPVLETSWSTARTLFPDAKVMTLNTGYSRSYGSYPYGDYRTNQNYLIFPISHNDPRLPQKERVLGIIHNGKSIVFRFGSFFGDMVVKNFEFQGESFVVAGSFGKNFLTAFYRETQDGTVLTFKASASSELTDTEGNTWNLFGEAISGPRAGSKLTPVNGYISYWFAWGTFWLDAVIN